ncbi:hypothetical protein Pla144_00590 [Bythopirellula polymerisocia]|uniref:Uncharacterized protein n=1 Tax=Bythopirellula polymerisocia TaxID=2528003 RepID=A0A5C6CWC3_9BACT|nr:hypothetical protein Pla144_00590 [Bythopirellula polymerisocia]
MSLIRNNDLIQEAHARLPPAKLKATKLKGENRIENIKKPESKSM